MLRSKLTHRTILHFVSGRQASGQVLKLAARQRASGLCNRDRKMVNFIHFHPSVQDPKFLTSNKIFRRVLYIIFGCVQILSLTTTPVAGGAFWKSKLKMWRIISKLTLPVLLKVALVFVFDQGFARYQVDFRTSDAIIDIRPSAKHSGRLLRRSSGLLSAARSVHAEELRMDANAN